MGVGESDGTNPTPFSLAWVVEVTDEWLVLRCFSFTNNFICYAVMAVQWERIYECQCRGGIECEWLTVSADVSRRTALLSHRVVHRWNGVCVRHRRNLVLLVSGSTWTQLSHAVVLPEKQWRSDGGAGRTGRQRGEKRRIFFLNSRENSDCQFHMCLCARKTKRYSQRVVHCWVLTRILMLLLTLRETYALNRLSSFKNRRKGGKFDHRPGRPKVLLRHCREMSTGNSQRME